MSEGKICSYYTGSSKFLIVEPDKPYCIFCYQFCLKDDSRPLIIEIKDDHPDKCCCQHNGEEFDVANDAIEDYFTRFDKIDPDDIIALNSVFNSNSEVMEKVFNKDTNIVRTDLEALRENNFKWEDIEVATIQQRYDLIILFNKKINNSYLSILNTAPIYQLYTLEYIYLLTDTPNYYYGTPLYNRSLDYYTELMNFFIIHYLERNLAGCDKIVAEEIETLSPLNRIEIRAKNLRNREFIDKFFSERFNAHKFVLNIIDKFIPGASWRFIGGKHKCHYYSVKIAKMLIEYGFLNEHQIDEIINLLYQKIPIFIRLEELIDADSARIDHKWINIWADGFREVREYFVEILIHQVYLKQDNEVLKMLEKLSKKKLSNFKLSDVEEMVSFQDGVLFQQEFGKKILDILLGYILSQNTILSKVLTTTKVEKIAINFLFIFSNTQDPYLQSLKLLNGKAIKDFLVNRKAPESKMLNEYSRKLRTLSRDTSSGTYFHEENIFFEQFGAIIKDLIAKLQSSKNKALQMEIASTNIISLTTDLIMIYYPTIISLERKDIGKLFLSFLREYIKKNSEAHCLFFHNYNINMINEFIKDFPVELTSLLLELMEENIGVAIVDSGQNQMILNLLEKIWSLIKEDEIKSADERKTDYYSAGINLFKTLKLFLDYKKYKNLYNIPEYDIKFAEILNSNLNEINIQILLDDIKNEDKSSDDKIKLEYIYQYLNTFQLTMNWRYTYEIFYSLKSSEYFKLEKLLEFVEISGENLKFRNLFLKFIDILYIDPKSKIINGRDELDLLLKDDPYNESQFYDSQYNLSLEFCKNEINFICSLNKNSKNFLEKEFNEYLEDHIIPIIMNISTYFSLIRSKGIPQIFHLIEPLKSLEDMLKINYDKLMKIFQNGKSGKSENSKQSNNYELSNLQLTSASNQRKILKEICTSIYDLCFSFLKCRNQNKNISNLISENELPLKSSTTTRVIKSYTNKIESINKKKKFQKNSEKLDIVNVLIKSYEKFKIEKLSVRKEENIYIAPLNDESSTENQRFCKNLCIFTINQLNKNWDITNLNYFYKIIECLSNCLFISTESLQNNIYIAMLEDPNRKDSNFSENVLNRIWNHLLNLLNYVKYKTNIDRVWKESFQRALLLIKFHQYICEDVNENFKSIMGSKCIPENDTRVTSALKMLENFCVNFGWSIEYKENEYGTFTRSQRSHLLPLGVFLFEFLEEVTSGPYLANQEIVYNRGYDMIRGLLKRYVTDINSDFYKMKLSLVNFIISVQEGQNEKIINNQTTELELQIINEVMINSLKQLFKTMIQKKSNIQNTFDETLKFSDKKRLLNSYESNEEFTSHPLLEISVKLYSYIKMISSKKLKFRSFCLDREEAISEFNEKKSWNKRIILEEDLVVYEFLSSIVSKIEVVRSKESNIEEVYFMIPPKCKYLTSETKREFLNEVDRKSHGTKLIGLINRIDYFNIEMEHLHGFFLRFKKFLPFGFQFNKSLEFLILFLSLFVTITLFFGCNNDGLLKKIIKWILCINVFLAFEGLITWLVMRWKVFKIMNREEYISKYSKANKLNCFDKIWINLFSSIILKGDALVFIIHIVCSLLGLFVSYGFIGIQILCVVNLSKTLQLLMKSIFIRAYQLSSTFFLGIIAIISVLTFSHTFLNKGFMDIDSFYGVTHVHCNNLSQCFFTILEQSYSNKSMGLFFEEDTDINPEYRFIIGITLFLIIFNILMNIFIGLIIDTYKYLNDKAIKIS